MVLSTMVKRPFRTLLHERKLEEYDERRHWRRPVGVDCRSAVSRCRSPSVTPMNKTKCGAPPYSFGVLSNMALWGALTDRPHRSPAPCAPTWLCMVDTKIVLHLMWGSQHPADIAFTRCVDSLWSHSWRHLKHTSGLS